MRRVSYGNATHLNLSVEVQSDNKVSFHGFRSDNTLKATILTTHSKVYNLIFRLSFWSL
jgi:hypothetical protein